MNDKYAQYLLSPEWKGIRAKVFLRDGRKCAACGSKKRLQAHHLTYARIFKEELSDLVSLCRAHHELVEELIRLNRIPRIGDTGVICRETLRLLGANGDRLRPCVKATRPSKPTRKKHKKKKRTVREKPTLSKRDSYAVIHPDGSSKTDAELKIMLSSHPGMQSVFKKAGLEFTHALNRELHAVPNSHQLKKLARQIRHQQQIPMKPKGCVIASVPSLE